MLNFINSIPDELGWALVGFLTCVDAIIIYKFGKFIAEVWREWHEDDEEVAEC